MRILHTSDWHLGVSTGPVSRIDEQTIFLNWLLVTLEEQDVDVLVVAGDVFDTMHPSAEAQQLYFSFLARVAATGIRDVVIVGGNHDSPSRLDAPQALLEVMNIHVVGGVSVAEERADQMIVPLRSRGSEGEFTAVCVAIPYVHEYRLGIRITDLDRQKTRKLFRDAFAALYSDLVDVAQSQYPGLPLIATGHLTIGKAAKRDDYPQEIHQVGHIEALPADLLDPRIQYTALGHIHRAYSIEGASAWYSGSPIAYSLAEVSPARCVLLVEVGAESEPPKVSKILVPATRPLVRLEGSPDEVLEKLRALTWTDEKWPPLVHLHMRSNSAHPGLSRLVNEALEEHARPGPAPLVVETQLRGIETVGTRNEKVPASLEEMTPQDVFTLLYQSQGIEEKDADKLNAAFRQIESATPSVLEEMLEEIIALSESEGGPE